ncbi:UDP-N-acetylmuramoyl-L-alanine--D-glutamate ligase [Acetobacteraceae bacterium KSS8]|uniref:UDP-N-acetylmuramoylalanine--D-glutamate ligase n=1 Tax=Endosaccharibacter trunci TaxID=2812733 RepID=A0ABT1W4J4_9PROT|nr:UDP-N-acetylmuramoyl-L-alanine--D-glutamate ligase [Acetobacteraceae bacterium KSS8]
MSGRFPPSLFAGRRFAVLGLGRNGGPVVRALSGMGAAIQCWDDGEASRAALVPLPERVTMAPIESLDGFDALVLSPGIPHILPKPHPVAAMARAAGVPVLSDAELLFQAVRASGSRARFVGITGTNGKSTTTALLAHMLGEAGVPVAAGGNLGPASLSLPLLPDEGVYVLEMSSYMLERLETLRFDAACLLNLSPDHLDRHGDMAGYARAKLEIFARQTPDDLAVIGLDDPDSRRIAATGTTARLVTVSGEAPGPLAGALSRAMALPGAHNTQNALAAAAMASHLGLTDAQIEAGIESFAGLPHRQRVVGTVGGVSFVDDSKATNADAASRALGCYDRLVWIAGGIAKSGGIDELAPFFPRVHEALLIGRDAPLLAETLSAHAVPHRVVDTLDRAVPEAFALAQGNDVPVVLLSPACASFDQFASFEARGQAFAALVGQLSTRSGEAA